MRKYSLVHRLVIIALIVLVLVFGLFPIMNREDEDLERFGYEPGVKYNVVVFGSEPEGIVAAIAAARTGVSVLLVTNQPDPSSYLTDALINSMPAQTGRVNNRPVSLNGSVVSELFGSVTSTFTSTEYLKRAMQLLSAEAGLVLYFESVLLEVATSAEVVNSVRLHTPDGVKTVRADIFIDATEDAVLLDKLQVPYFTGSEDINAPNVFEPLAFNFRIRGVDWEDIKTIARVNDFRVQFSDILFRYPRNNENVKLIAPSLIRQDEDAVVVSGLQLAFVDPGDPDAVSRAWQIAVQEAMFLTAYLQTELQPFANATWDVAAYRLFIPEHRHFMGIDHLTVADILNNRDRKDKVALLSDPVSAQRFLRGDDLAILSDPNVYAVPLGSLVPKGWDNVMMLGRSPSFSSLASTSATTTSARVVIGEGAGLAAAWCILENIDPSEVPTLPEERQEQFVSFIERAGQILTDFNEPLTLEDGRLLKDTWMSMDIEELVSMGVLMGGMDNDFRITEGQSENVLAVLASNALMRMAPELYSLELDTRLSAIVTDAEVTHEKAAEILLELANIRTVADDSAVEQLFDWLKLDGEWSPPPELADRWENPNTEAENGDLYHLVLAVCRQIIEDAS